MLKTIKITSPTGNELEIYELLEDYVIDFFKQNNAAEVLPHPVKWVSMTNSSSPEIADKASWSWNVRQKEDGATGICTIYLKSNEQIRSQTSEKIVKDDAVYTVEITVIS